MSLRWPWMLLSLLVVPLLVLAYLRVSARRARACEDIGTMGQLLTRAGKPLGFRRHVPAAIFLIGVIVLLVGMARPAATVELQHRRGTVILAFDVSNSMNATDIEPTRIDAAKKAARAFVRQQPSTIRIGVVAFSDAGLVTEAPTHAKRRVLTAITRLSTGGATSVGDAILTSLGSIAGKPLKIDPQALANGTQQADVPFLPAAVVILLSDGENTARLDPVAAAGVAQQAGVRVDAVGLGTAAGAVVTIDGFNVATTLDEELLREVAKTTNGTYSRAADAAALTRIYGSIDLKLRVSGKRTEVTGAFAGAGVLILLAGAALSMRWFGRVP